MFYSLTTSNTSKIKLISCTMKIQANYSKMMQKIQKQNGYNQSLLYKVKRSSHYVAVLSSMINK